ncbi:MAG: ribonuclease PH [Coriobacteriales bacterium]|jgi:ribonuclease PH|nr:ribonuclease PH [Coriobacteriales bacterium]
MAQRTDGRADDALRPVFFERAYLKNTYGSCLVSFGDTRVLCAVSIEEGVPNWRKSSGKGWLTAEYAMLPASTGKRTRRETNGPVGRSQEIQRLIGRSLRSVVDLNALGEITITVDCDVVQADGGTRTAAICGAWVALRDALTAWRLAGRCKGDALFGQIAAISVGMVDGRLLLDLDYHEDSRAEIDMNLVMNAHGEFVEVQGTGERATFDRARLNALLDLGLVGLEELLSLQRAALP